VRIHGPACNDLKMVSSMLSRKVIATAPDNTACIGRGTGGGGETEGVPEVSRDELSTTGT
jgi:hypothetical protein